MKKPAKIVIILLVVAAASAAIVLKGAKQRNAANATTPVSATTTEATAVTLSDAAAKLPKLLDLGATKCVPCKMMAPILEELKKEYAGKLKVEFIDVWENEDAGKQYGVEMIPTQIFYNANGKELFRHTGFFGKEDILAKWKELGIDISGSKQTVSIVRETPLAADTRPADSVCFMCDETVNAKTKTVVKGQTDQHILCSPHCYFIYFSSLVNPDAKAEDAKVSVTDSISGNLIPAATASYVYGMDAKGRATTRTFESQEAATKDSQSNPGNVVSWDVLKSKELATRCAFCDRAVYPEDACSVKFGSTHGYGCCTHCSMGVAARLKQNIEVEAKDALTGEAIRIRTLDGQIASLEPASSIAWFGQKKGPDGKWISAGCFKQGFFVNATNLQKWLDARPAMTGRQITIAQALSDKMKLSPEQIAKACKLGECN